MPPEIAEQQPTPFDLQRQIDFLKIKLAFLVNLVSDMNDSAVTLAMQFDEIIEKEEMGARHSFSRFEKDVFWAGQENLESRVAALENRMLAHVDKK